MDTQNGDPHGRVDIPALFPTIYAELQRLARRYLSRERRSHTLQPTALVHEAWLKLQQERQIDWRGRTHVLAIGAQAMRRVLVDHGRGQKRQKRGGAAARVTLHDWAAAVDAPLSVEDLLALDAALTRLGELDARQASIVELRFFGGLTVPEVAESLGVSTRTVEAEWTHARAWLNRALASATT